MEVRSSCCVSSIFFVLPRELASFWLIFLVYRLYLFLFEYADKASLSFDLWSMLIQEQDLPDVATGLEKDTFYLTGQ